MKDIGFFISAAATAIASFTFLVIRYRDRRSVESTLAKQIDDARARVVKGAAVYVAYSQADKFVWSWETIDMNPPGVIASAEEWIDLSTLQATSWRGRDLAPGHLNTMISRIVKPRPDDLRKQSFSAVPRSVGALA